MNQDISSYYFDKIDNFREKLILYLKHFKTACLLDSCYTKPANKKFFNKQSFNLMAGIGIKKLFKPTPDKNIYNRLYEFQKTCSNTIMGYFGYDLKSQTFNLSQNNADRINAPEILFFEPEILIKEIDRKIEIICNSKTKAEKTFNEINKIEVKKKQNKETVKIIHSISKQEYLEKIAEIKNDIQRGIIYEMNFCQEFFAEKVNLSPAETYLQLTHHSPTPFASYFKYKNIHALCASPERFLKKENDTIISQPIKGTAPRGKTREEDIQNATQLKENPKEQAENIMIVDLVRNDLSQTAAKGSVKVEELCGVYSFPQVHQLISTISSNLSNKFKFTDCINKAFPPGSMTGAPKISAMTLIEKYEKMKRGIYSGAIGYITPNQDFDFNVVIRTLLYNSENKNLSYITGGAITANSIPEAEYEECIVKGKAINDILSKF